MRVRPLDPTLVRAILEVVRLRDTKSLPLLLRLLEELGPDSPLTQVPVAIGVLGDEGAAEALLRLRLMAFGSVGRDRAATYAGLGLASLGSVATSPTLAMLRGEGNWPAFAERHEMDAPYLVRTAAEVLGDLGDTAAVSALLEAALPCDGPDSQFWGPKCATAFTALGNLGHEDAVAPLCGHVHAHLDGEGTPQALSALGHIGGREATRCLLSVLIDADAETRQIAFAAALNSCDSSNLGEVADAAARFRRLRKARQDTLSMLTLCKDEPACYRAVVRGAEFPPRLKVVAAHHLVRLVPGDLDTAQLMSEAFRVELAKAIARGDSRHTEALIRLVPRAAAGRVCLGCVADIQAALDEAGDLRVEWLDVVVQAARVAIARVGEPGRNYERSLIRDRAPDRDSPEPAYRRDRVPHSE